MELKHLALNKLKIFMILLSYFVINKREIGGKSSMQKIIKDSLITIMMSEKFEETRLLYIFLVKH